MNTRILPTLVSITLFILPLTLKANVPDGVWVRDGFKLTVVEDTIQKPRFLEF